MGTVSLITLTPKTPENVADVQTNFDNLASTINGGLDAANVTDNSLGVGEIANGATGLARGTFHASNNDATYTLGAGGIPTKVKFNVEDFDLSAWFDAASGYRFTPQLAGYYRLSTYVELLDPLNAGEYFIVVIRKNGADYRRVANLVASSGLPFGAGGSCVVVANGTTDYFDVYATQGNAATRRIQGSGDRCWFSGELIGKS
jgi:hypothetical protein